MARSAHSYVRGNTLKFYEWLAAGNGKSLPAGRDLWICGDFHLGTLGPVANVDGDIEIQIRDFDQAVVGSSAHDLVRLGLSSAMSARGPDLPGVATATILEEVVKGYLSELTTPSSHRPTRQSAVIANVMKEAMRRRWRHLATERIEDVEAQVPLGKRFWLYRERTGIDRGGV